MLYGYILGEIQITWRRLEEGKEEEGEVSISRSDLPHLLLLLHLHGGSPASPPASGGATNRCHPSPSASLLFLRFSIHNRSPPPPPSLRSTISFICISTSTSSRGSPASSPPDGTTSAADDNLRNHLLNHLLLRLRYQHLHLLHLFLI
jgi:hypothetical protein